MLKFFFLACFLALASADPQLIPAPIYPSPYIAPYNYLGGYRYGSPYPLAYSKINPALSSGSSSFSAVSTPNSFQQQYREDFRPLAYSLIY